MNFLVIDPPDSAGHKFRFYQTPFAPDPVSEIAKWCLDSFGEPDTPNYYSRWTRFGTSFWFRDDVDAFAFRMRWC